MKPVLYPLALFLAGGLVLAQTSGEQGQVGSEQTGTQSGQQYNSQYGSTSQQQGTQSYAPGISSACSTNSNISTDTNQQIQRSQAAMEVLKDTNQARIAAVNRNTSQADQCIGSALNAISRIQAVNPNAQSAQNGTASNLVPIYTELGEVSVLGPIQQERQMRANAGSVGQSGAQGSAARSANPNESEAYGQNNAGNMPGSTSGQSGSAETVQGVTQQFTSVTLNVNMAKDHLLAAKTAVNNGNFVAATDALNAVDDSVNMVSVAADRPLLRARENLMLARDYARQGKYESVSAPLRAAADALNSYGSMNPTHSSEATQLSDQIRNYAQNVSSSANQNQSNAAQRIEQWWQQAQSWTSTATK